MDRFRGVDVLRADQFSREDLEVILEKARTTADALERGEALDAMQGKILATLFFEPSTRTRLSFEAAMLRLGGKVVSVADPKSSSAVKGESLPDTIRTVEGYADVIVLRHPERGSAEEAAEATDRPVINAGDGAGQHPTQALLDLFTIFKERGRVEGLTVTLAGDLKHGRTVHSLSQVLSHYGVKMILASPETLKMPSGIVDGLRSAGVDVEETVDLQGALSRSDVLYMTRVQRERFDDPASYERVKGAFILTRKMVEASGRDTTVMHPLPRVDEIAADVDPLPGAAYFRQAANGVPVRMALLALVVGLR